MVFYQTDPHNTFNLFGAVGGDRTHDLFLTKEVPYHLATTAYLVGVTGVEPVNLLHVTQALYQLS